MRDFICAASLLFGASLAWGIILTLLVNKHFATKSKYEMGRPTDTSHTEYYR